jgi:hypothetical protein
MPANAFVSISVVTFEQCTNCSYERGIREGLQQLKTGRHSIYGRKSATDMGQTSLRNTGKENFKGWNNVKRCLGFYDGLVTPLSKTHYT